MADKRTRTANQREVSDCGLGPDDFDREPVDLEFPDPYDAPPPPGASFGLEVADALELISSEKRDELLRSAQIRELAGESVDIVKVWLIREALRPARAAAAFAPPQAREIQSKGGQNRHARQRAKIEAWRHRAELLHRQGATWPIVMRLCEDMARASDEKRMADARFADLPDLGTYTDEGLARALWDTRSLFRGNRRPKWASS